MSLYVKICGLRTAADVAAAVAAGADAIGFVLTGSPRQVTPAEARALAAEIPPEILTVGVFAGEPVDVIRAAATEAGVGAIQLHGDHPRADFEALADLPAQLVRATTEAAPDLRTGAYGEELLIVDAHRPGSGEPWDWGSLAARGLAGRWLLAGGLDPENVRAAARAAGAWGVDVSSGVEASRGVKDPELIRRFLDRAKRG